MRTCSLHSKRSTDTMRALVSGFVLLSILCVHAQQPATPARETVTGEQVKGAIDKLGTLDFQVRSDAARTVRRASPETAVPALTEAVASHKDEYVRFRALVLLSGFNDASTRDVMARMLGEKSDRLRSVA